MIVLKRRKTNCWKRCSVAGIVERRHTLPILANVLLRKTGEDIAAHHQRPGDPDAHPGRRWAAMRQLQHHGGRAQADRHPAHHANDQLVSLESQQAQADPQGRQEPLHAADLPAEDFPLVQEGGELRPRLQRAAEDAEDLLNQVHFAMAVHDIRYYLNGILFVAEGKQLTPGGHRRPPPGVGQRHAGDRGAPSRRSSCRARPCWSCSAC
jgi:DNA polymerase-3 subunit beta